MSSASNRRHWQVRVTTLDANADIASMDALASTPAERVESMVDCVLAMRLVQGKRGIPRFRRVYRVLER